VTLDHVTLVQDTCGGRSRSESLRNVVAIVVEGGTRGDDRAVADVIGDGGGGDGGSDVTADWPRCDPSTNGEHTTPDVEVKQSENETFWRCGRPATKLSEDS